VGVADGFLWIAIRLGTRTPRWYSERTE
jgi:hypothetical protein